MNTVPNIHRMRELSGELLDDFLILFDRLMVRRNGRAHMPYGLLTPMEGAEVSEQTPPSSRLTCDAALAYLAAHIETPNPARLETAFSLLRYAFSRQHADGYFVWNYGQHEIDNVDLGTVLDTYWWFWTQCPDLPSDVCEGIVDSTRRAIDYLKTMHQPTDPGIIQKRAADPDHPDERRTADYMTIDVLNGNALAATAYCRAADILEEPSLVDRAAMLEANLVDSFSRHVPGWWVYIEQLGGREMLGPETILYQAMTALYLEPLYRARPSESLRDVLAESLNTLAAITDPAGRLDWSHESRKIFVGTPLLMLPSAAVALADVCDITEAARRRMDFVAAECYDRQTHEFICETGEPANELIQIWTASDLGLILLNAKKRFSAGGAPAPPA